MGYQMIKLKSLYARNKEWHAAKLAEEVGEVCQAVCKKMPKRKIAEECIDVIHSAECMLRKLGFSSKEVTKLMKEEDEDCRLRNLDE